MIFALKNRENKIVSLYGRSIYNDAEARHFYTRSRQGLYPNYPKVAAKQLILTEAVIDAATLLQIEAIRTQYEILACYGTNGFTAEHEAAIIGLKQLEEIIIFFDGDEAGREGTKRISEKLHQLNPEVKLSSVATPEGEDVNSLATSHEPAIFQHLLESRTAFIFLPAEASAQAGSIEKKNASVTPSLFSKAINGSFDSSNPLKLIYRTMSANYYIKGGLRNEADSLRVSLDIEHPQSQRKSRSKVDLYEDKQVEKIARESAEKLQLRADLIQLDLELFTELLEQYREDHKTKESAPPDTGIPLQYGKQAP